MDGFSVDVSDLQSISSPMNHSIYGGSVNATGAPGVKPENYGSMMVYTDDDGEGLRGAWRADGGLDVPRGRCGSVYSGLLDDWDSLQILELSTVSSQMLGGADAVVDGGSYRLELGGEKTRCISYAASAIEVRKAIEDLRFVPSGNVRVKAFEAKNQTGFPFRYSIQLLGSYVDGDWPQLRVDPDSFGKTWSGVPVGVKSGCEEFSVVNGGGVPLAKSNVTAAVIPMAEHSACAGGNDEVQIVVAEADTALGGSLDLYFNGQVVSGFPVNGSPRDLEARLMDLEGVDAVEVTKHVHSDQPYGVAYAVTFTGQRGRRDLLAAGASHLTGNDAAANVYPLVNVSTMALLDDLEGTFVIQVGQEVTAPLRWDATHGKVLHALHALDSVGRVAILGAPDGALEAAVILSNETHCGILAAIEGEDRGCGVQEAVVLGDLTSAVAPGDALRLTNATDDWDSGLGPSRVVTALSYFKTFQEVPYLLRGNLTQMVGRDDVADMGGVTILELSSPFRPQDVMRGGQQLYAWGYYGRGDDGDSEFKERNLMGAYRAFIGARTKAKAALPGKVSFAAATSILQATPEAGVTNGIDYSRIVYLEAGGVAALNATTTSGSGANGTSIVVDGATYEITDVNHADCGADCVQLATPLHVSVDASLPYYAVFPEFVTAATTADLRGALYDGGHVWVAEARFDVFKVSATELRLKGPFVDAAVGATAFGWAHGYAYDLVFKDFTSPLAADPGGARKLDAVKALRARPFSGWRGTGGQLRYSLPFGIEPRTDVVGALSEVQTVALRAASATAAASAAKDANFTLSMAHNDQYFSDGTSTLTTTAPIRWGATAADVTAALLELNEVDQVTVARSGDGASASSEFGYVYTMTFWGSSHADLGIPEMVPELFKPDASYGTPQNRTSIHVDTVREGVAPGRHASKYVSFASDTEYTFRVSAKNAIGFGPPSPTVSATTALAVPGAPTAVVLGEHYDGESLSLAWQPPFLDGGATISAYRVELDSSAGFDAASDDYVVEEVAFVHEIQTITTHFRSGEAARRGTFTLSWGGGTTAALDHDATADEVADAVGRRAGKGGGVQCHFNMSVLEAIPERKASTL